MTETGTPLFEVQIPRPYFNIAKMKQCGNADSNLSALSHCFIFEFDEMRLENMSDYIDLKKSESENYHQYIWRIDSLIQSGKYKNWKDITPLINEELFGDDESQYRDESAYRKAVKYARDFYEANVFGIEDEYLKKLQFEKRELEKVKVQVQTEKLEYSRWIREEARDELIIEKICNAVSSLPSLDIPHHIYPIHGDRAYALVFGDEHYGVEFELNGLFGDIINSYSPEIFEKRMWDLFEQTIEIIQKENIDTLNVFSMGDFSDGILRVSQLMKLRYGVVDSAIKYADFISNWLNELTKYVRVKYQSTNGNHTELRMIGQPKGTFTEDNMGKVVAEFIKARLKDNPNFTYIENPTGYIYEELAGHPILGIHGEVKNMGNAIREFSSVYGVNIQYLLAGHLHHNKVEEVGVNQEVINVGSVIGIDSYSLSLRKTANASSKLLVFERDKGKVCEYTLKLN